MWRQLPPPVKKKDLEKLIKRQETCFIRKFIVSYEPGARIGRLIPNGFASCIYHNGMIAVLEDGVRKKPSAYEKKILQDLEEMSQTSPLISAEQCKRIQSYIARLYESENKVEWLPLNKFLNRYSGYIRNAERLPDPQRLEHTIYRKIKEAVELWESALQHSFISE